MKEYRHDYTSFGGAVPIEVEATLNAAVAYVQAGAIKPSCYMVSEAMVRVLRNLGRDAEPMLADVYAWNGDSERLSQDGRLMSKWLTRDKQGFRNRRKLNRIKPYTLSLNHEQEVEGDGYDGHVVVKVDGWILDATFGQFDRPEKNLRAGPFTLIPIERFDDSMKKRGTKFGTFIEKKSVDAGMMSMCGDDDEGYFIMALRPDLKPTYLDHTPTARANTAAFAKDLEREVRTVLNLLRDRPIDNGGTPEDGT